MSAARTRAGSGGRSLSRGRDGGSPTPHEFGIRGVGLERRNWGLRPSCVLIRLDLRLRSAGLELPPAEQLVQLHAAGDRQRRWRPASRRAGASAPRPRSPRRSPPLRRPASAARGATGATSDAASARSGRRSRRPHGRTARSAGRRPVTGVRTRPSQSECPLDAGTGTVDDSDGARDRHQQPERHDAVALALECAAEARDQERQLERLPSSSSGPRGRARS